MAESATGKSATPKNENVQGRRKEVVGEVVANRMQKTIVVKVERRFTHPLLKKTVRRSKNYHAHDETKNFKVGDMVSIEETKPISKLKRWAVVRGEKKKAS